MCSHEMGKRNKLDGFFRDVLIPTTDVSWFLSAKHGQIFD